MLGSSFLALLAGGELGLDPGPVPPEIPTDEHGLALLHPGVELHPGELVAAAGEVEEAVPVAAREAHDALGTEYIDRQAPEQPLEGVLPEGQPGAVEEAPDAVGVQVVGARARPLAEGRDAGREEHVAVERATHGLHALGARVQLRQPSLEQQMQPLVSSTIFSTFARPVTTLPSIPTSPISFIMTATGFPRRPCSSTWRRSVVFPLPRKPVRMSTATVRISGAAGRRARRARAVPSGGAAWARCRRSTPRAAGREAAPPRPRSRG